MSEILHQHLWQYASSVEPETCRYLGPATGPIDDLPDYLFTAEIDDGIWGLFVHRPLPKSRFVVTVTSYVTAKILSVLHEGTDLMPYHHLYAAGESEHNARWFLDNYDVRFVSAMEPNLYTCCRDFEIVLIQRAAAFMEGVMQPCDC